MTAQLELDAGASSRDVGLRDALSHYAVEAVRLAIRDVASRRDEFTAEDVVDSLLPITRDSLSAFPNALGACFRAAAKANEIFDTGKMTRARHAAARKRKMVVWSRHRPR